MPIPFLIFPEDDIFGSVVGGALNVFFPLPPMMP